MNPPTFNDISIAREFVGQYRPRTPLVRAEKLSEMLGCDYYVKLENLHPVGAFKVRGGINLVGTATDEDKTAGMISSSTFFFLNYPAPPEISSLPPHTPFPI